MADCVPASARHGGAIARLVGEAVADALRQGASRTETEDRGSCVYVYAVTVFRVIRKPRPDGVLESGPATDRARAGSTARDAVAAE